MVWSLEKNTQSWMEGYFDLPGRPPYMRDAFERASYLQGQRVRARQKELMAAAPKQTFREAIPSFFGVAGAAAGFLFGLWRVGEGQGTWLGVGGFLVGGILLGLLVYGILAGIVRRIYEAFLWSRGRDERDAAMLILMWGTIFGHTILPHLVAEIDEQGRAWTVDGKGNFRLRTRSGNTFFVRRTSSGGASVQTKGRGSELETAYLMALIQRSTGKEKIRMDEGRKQARRNMWAAATLVGLEMEGYVPDQKAIGVLARMQEDERFEAVKGWEASEGDGAESDEE